jgi:alpha-D-ribose 1-methylphosphonate 5-triphosphate synthase subunit PhnG
MCILGLSLAGCAADLPMPTMPTLSTDTQREQARACQQGYTQCRGTCGTTGMYMALGAQQINELTKCTNNCKQLLADCYKTLP